METIVGRKTEKKTLEGILNSNEAEFVAIYGRRRVGKTFLIREFCSKRSLYFELTGIKDGSLKDQLANFSIAFSACFCPGVPVRICESWREAFELLTQEIEKKLAVERVTIFLDELPWLASKRSGLLQNLDYFWNTKWSRMPKMKLIVCGSAASWMIEHLINAKGGLHNRLTKTILLEPFDLLDTNLFLKSRGIQLNNKQVLDIYMVIGGVAHYLKQIEKSKSAIQNINDICFKKTGLLYDEFPRLFRSLFETADLNLKIFQEISKRREGISRDELLRKVDLKTGGTFNLRIKELEAAGFIRTFIPYGKKKKYHTYRVIDEYSNFYLYWISDLAASKTSGDFGYWQSKSQTPGYSAWSGYAFEGICIKHVDLIKKSMGLDQTPCEIGNFKQIPKRGQVIKGAQIDLLFDRSDGVISLCEIKYSSDEFAIDKSYARELSNKIDVFEQTMKTKKQLFLTFITTSGLKKNLWSEDLISDEVRFLELF